MIRVNKKIKKIIIMISIILVAYFVISFRNIPEEVDYGVSFNTLYARELGLEWKDVYDAILDD